MTYLNTKCLCSELNDTIGSIPVQQFKIQDTHTMKVGDVLLVEYRM